MANFPLIFGITLVVNILLTYKSTRKSSTVDSTASEGTSKEWKSLITKYLAVYLLATLSDWLQGPYVYALYADYGYSQHDIAVLFVAGFGSSMVFGSFIGGMADWGGRRRFVILFAITYAFSCLTKRKYTTNCPHTSIYFFFLNSYTICRLSIKTLRISTFSCWDDFWEAFLRPCFLVSLKHG